MRVHTRHLTLPPPPARDASPAEHWRHRRNIVIYLIHRQGAPHQLIADAFDLGTAQVRSIINSIAIHDRSHVDHSIPAPDPSATLQLPEENEADGTPIQRWRARRNAVIGLAYRLGLSRELIADVFSLRRSTLNEILRGPLMEDRPSPRRHGHTRGR
jgi:hypothetical protein